MAHDTLWREERLNKIRPMVQITILVCSLFQSVRVARINGARSDTHRILA